MCNKKHFDKAFKFMQKLVDKYPEHKRNKLDKPIREFIEVSEANNLIYKLKDTKCPTCQMLRNNFNDAWLMILDHRREIFDLEQHNHELWSELQKLKVSDE